MSLIRQVIEAVQSSGGVINLNELSRQLDVQPAALQGILVFCAQKGFIRLDTHKPQSCSSCGAAARCGVECDKNSVI